MKNKKFSIADFNTTNGESEGRKFTLVQPDGEPTDEWVLLYGLSSPAMKAAMAAHKAELKKLGKESSSDIDSPANCKLLAAAIKDWSLEDTCNYDNRLKLITESEPNRILINAVVQNTRLFFRLGHVPSWNPEEKPATENKQSNQDTQSDSSSSGSETPTV